jgi:hypothetical protein
MFTFGSDPEFFLFQKGKFKSAIPVLPNKESPIYKDGCAFYYDNVLAEAQVKPASSKAEAVENIGNCIRLLSEIVEPYKLVLQSAQNFPDSELKDEDARTAGCMPEWSVYTLEQILPPKEVITTTGFRTAGGHVHLGESPVLANGLQILNVVRMLDLFLGVPSVLLDRDKTARARREIYGHAGTHRVPDHGLEYRPLSNYWLASPALVELVYDICGFTLNFVENRLHERYWCIDENMLDEDDPSLAHRCFGYDKDMLQKCINTCDKKLAGMFMLIVENHMPRHIIERIEDFQNRDFDLYKDWDL